MPFAASHSEHPDPSYAIGEVLGSLIETIGVSPSLATVFVTGAHVDALADITMAINAILQPEHLVGTTASSIIGGAREVEERPAISMWAARFARPVDVAHLEALRGPDGVAIVGLDRERFEAAEAVVMVADPLSFPLDEFLAMLRDQGSAVPIIGGVASAAFTPGGNRLVHDRDLHDAGAVAVLIPEGAVGIATVVSQGCRPIGEPLTVTKAERNLMEEIAGKPAYTRLVELIERLPEEDRHLAEHGLHLGRVIDEHKLDFERGDFLVRNLVGADRATGAIAVNDFIDVGATVQFQVRDADAADDDLRALLTGKTADAALVFTCNGRGSNLFGEPDHDASVVADYLGEPPAAGMFCAGEIGPIGGRTFLHGFTASIALFTDL